MPKFAGAALAIAALTALVIAPAPAYDPWAWLLWGREIAHGTLSTEEMPAFKPLTVAVCTLLAPLGERRARGVGDLRARRRGAGRAARASGSAVSSPAPRAASWPPPAWPSPAT